MIHPITTDQVCLQLLQHMVTSTYVVRHAELRLRLLRICLASVYSTNRHHLGSMLTVPSLVLASLNWWRDLRLVMMGVPFVAPQPSVYVVLDASDLGWGAHLNSLRTQGLWSQEELSLHVNDNLHSGML